MQKASPEPAGGREAHTRLPSGLHPHLREGIRVLPWPQPRGLPLPGDPGLAGPQMGSGQVLVGKLVPQPPGQVQVRPWEAPHLQRPLGSES